MSELSCQKTEQDASNGATATFDCIEHTSQIDDSEVLLHRHFFGGGGRCLLGA